MSTDIRLITDAEHPAWLDQIMGAFFEHPSEGAQEYLLSTYDPGRARGAFDGDRVVGTLRSFATELTVPGPSSIPASALTAVSVAPTHRRRGVLTSMIEPDLRDSAQRGEAVSILLASEYPIYGRFGYGPATSRVGYEIATTGLRFLTPSQGSVELVDLPTLRELAPPVYERFRVAQPGSIGRSDEWWDRVLRQVQVPGIDPWKGFQALYRSPAGDVEGFVMYEGKMDWGAVPSRGTLAVSQLVTVTPGAYRALWEFCCNVDLTTFVTAGNRSTDEVLPFLVDDARKVRVVAEGDFLWVRILDTAAALAGRRYGSEDRLVLLVHDDLALASGRFALEASPAGASCAATPGQPDLSLPVRALGAVYLGGVSFARLAEAGLVDEHTPGALAAADRLFMTPRAPWCTTNF